MNRRLVAIWAAVAIFVLVGCWALIDLHTTDLYVVGGSPPGIAYVHMPDPALLNKLEECFNISNSPASKRTTDWHAQLVNEIATQISADNNDPAIMNNDSRLARLYAALALSNKDLEEQNGAHDACQKEYDQMVSKSNFAVGEFAMRSACARARERYAVTFSRQRWFCDVPPVEPAATRR